MNIFEKKFKKFVSSCPFWLQNILKAPLKFIVLVIVLRKRKVLRKFGIKNADWIETGTYKGQTSKYLSKYFNHVHTVESHYEFFEKAKKTFQTIENISHYLGLSEIILKDLLPQYYQKSLNIFLDAHGVYFDKSSLSPTNTPILQEIEIIVQNLKNDSDWRIFIDDMRFFDGKTPGYPKIDQILEKFNSLQYQYFGEKDILIIHKINSIFEK